MYVLPSIYLTPAYSLIFFLNAEYFVVSAFVWWCCLISKFEYVHIFVCVFTPQQMFCWLFLSGVVDWSQNLWVCAYTCMYIYTSTDAVWPGVGGMGRVFLIFPVSTCVHINKYIRVWVCVCVYMRAWESVCVCACVCVCAHKNTTWPSRTKKIQISTPQIRQTAMYAHKYKYMDMCIHTYIYIHI